MSSILSVRLHFGEKFETERVKGVFVVGDLEKGYYVSDFVALRANVM